MCYAHEMRTIDSCMYLCECYFEIEIMNEKRITQFTYLKKISGELTRISCIPKSIDDLKKK